ncbi:MAG: hypothetical protein K1X94_31990 [Sandaracinaceae bacterium]|nr:hypothetical protein [Sandaracinaceae bacterium]
MSAIGAAVGVAWELPQTALGVALLGLELARGHIRSIDLTETSRAGTRLVCETTGAAISLGHVVLWCRESNRWHELDARNRDHELGHAVQSRILGPLYLPIVGVPSSARAVYAVIHRELRGHKWPRYYQGFPEAWADQLGGVAR